MGFGEFLYEWIINGDPEAAIKGASETNSQGAMTARPTTTKTLREGKAGDRYFRLKLVEMRLDSNRRWFQDVTPALQTVVTVPISDGTSIEVASIIGPDVFKSIGDGEFALQNHTGIRLTDWIPYNTGTVRIVSGLLSVPAGDGLGAAVDILASLSTLVAVPALTTVAGVAAKVAEGAETVLRTKKTRGVVALNHGFAGVEAAPQYIIAVGQAVPFNSVELYSYEKGVLYFDGEMVRDVAYILLELEVRQALGSDWKGIPAIANAFDAAVAELYNKGTATAEPLLLEAYRIARTSKDLTFTDRDRVVEQLEKAWAKLLAKREAQATAAKPKPVKKSGPNEAALKRVRKPADDLKVRLEPATRLNFEKASMAIERIESRLY